MTANKTRLSFRLYLTAEQFQFFQIIAYMLWKNGTIQRPTISKLSKMALNTIGNQFIEHYGHPGAKGTQKLKNITRQEAPMDTGAK